MTITVLVLCYFTAKVWCSLLRFLKRIAKNVCQYNYVCYGRFQVTSFEDVMRNAFLKDLHEHSFDLIVAKVLLYHSLLTGTHSKDSEAKLLHVIC